jgi:hypothetical protein
LGCAEAESSERIDIARKELEWISAKKELQLSRLRNHYIDRVAVERICLVAFRQRMRTATFRTPRLSLELRAAIEQVHAYLNQEEERLAAAAAAPPTRRASQPGSMSHLATPAPSEFHGDDELAMSAAGPASGGEDEEAGARRPLIKTAAMSKVEQRKLQRAERQRLWDKLLARKPAEDHELPEDTMAVVWAQKNMGDFKLKSAAGYVVPEHMRISAEKKRREMVLLEEAVYAIKMVCPLFSSLLSYLGVLIGVVGL